MTIMVEVISSSFVQFFISNDMDSRKNTPQINDSLDKNKSQRIGDFPVK
jgi:hypothetical protein